MKNFHKSPMAIVMGASLLPMAVSIAQAETNPFSLSELGSGYMQTAEAAPQVAGAATKMKDGACGEGKCGAAMKKDAAADKKAVEGVCAGKKTPPAPAPASTPATTNVPK